jgi:hypothetical protein
MTGGKRDYEKEKTWEKNKKPTRVKDRAARNKARKIMIEKLGKAALVGRHVDHKKALVSGGSNAKSNLRVVSAKTNLSKEAQRKKK